MKKDVAARVAVLEESIRQYRKKILHSGHTARCEAGDKLRRNYKVPCRSEGTWPKWLRDELAELQAKALESRQPLIDKWTRKMEAQQELLARLLNRQNEETAR